MRLERRLLALLLGASSAAFAGSPWVARAGARDLAMGSAMGVAAHGIEALSQDPAALLESTAWMLGHTFWVQDLRSEQAALAWRHRAWALGSGLDLQEAPSVELRAEDGRWLGSRTLRRDEGWLAASYSARAWTVGLRGSALQGDLEAPRVFGGAGAQWRPSRGLSMGAAIDWDGPEPAWRSGLAFEPRKGWTLGGGYTSDPGDQRLGFGVEAAPYPSWAVRAGWQQLQQDPEPERGGRWSLGLGLRLSEGWLDYAWAQLGGLGQAQRLQWSAAFGPRQAEARPTATVTPSPTLLWTMTATPSSTPSPWPSPTITALPTVEPTRTPSPMPKAQPQKPVNLRFIVPN